MEGLWKTGRLSHSTHMITTKIKLIKYFGKEVSGHRKRKRRLERTRKKTLELQGKIFISFKIMRSLAVEEHMLGTGGEDRKNG